MNITEFTYLINHPNAINEKQAKSLETVLDNFPYFQSARALHLKGLYNQDSYKYNFALKNTAAHTTDRSVLFDFITSDEFTIIEKDIYQQKLAQLLNIDVNESEHLNQETVLIESIESNESETITDEIIDKKNDEVKFVPIIQTIIEEEIEKSTADVITFDPETSSIEETVTNEFRISESDFENLHETIIEEVIESKNEVATFISETISIEETITEEYINNESTFENLAETEPALEEVEPDVVITTQVSDSKELEENLEIGKPIPFIQSEKHSFQEWLQLASFKPIDRETITENIKTEPIIDKTEESSQEEKSDKKTKKIELIDKFIENNPKITPARELVDTPTKPIEIPDTTHLMTETLARVYLEQKKYGKAIQAYEILILKYPEKSIFFADRIQNIKILQQNNQ